MGDQLHVQQEGDLVEGFLNVLEVPVLGQDRLQALERLFELGQISGPAVVKSETQVQQLAKVSEKQRWKG